MNNLIEKAIAKSAILHADQKRKGDSDTPYIVHPMHVAIIVSRYTRTPALLAAAVLHDTVEDGDYLPEDLESDFGVEVKDLVLALSEDTSIPDWADRKNENLKRLRLSQDAYFIKSADALANMLSLITALRENGDMVWSRFNASREQKMQYFKVILEDTENFLPKELIKEYVAALKDLEYSEFFAKRSPAFGFTV